MSINPGLQIPYGIQPTNPLPVDAWSGPFIAGSFNAGISAANSAIPIAFRFQSMEVRLIVGGASYKYWYSGGTGDGNLVPFSTGAPGPTGAPGSTGATPTNYVSSFNGVTGAVTGITAGGINTFTQLNTFSAGISASGATFTGLISGTTATFFKDIIVRSMTVGLGGSSQISNVAIGYEALALNTSNSEDIGIYNTGVGSSALSSNTTGSSNTGVGSNALITNTEGSYNVGVGTYALFSNTTGGENVGVGTNALGANTTGGENVGVGTNALVQNTTGGENVGVGTNALYNNTIGSNKTALGFAAGQYRGTGVSTLTTGTGGIYIGYQARGSANARTNEIVIGVDALGLGSNTAVIGATLQSAATIYGVLNLPSGLSTTGATFTGPISSTRMARHTSAAISAVQTVSFSPTVAEDGTVFYINYSGKGSVLVTLEGLPIGWRAKFLNVGNGIVNFASTTGDIHGEGGDNFLGTLLMEAICIANNEYFVG